MHLTAWVKLPAEEEFRSSEGILGMSLLLFSARGEIGEQAEAHEEITEQVGDPGPHGTARLRFSFVECFDYFS